MGAHGEQLHRHNIGYYSIGSPPPLAAILSEVEGFDSIAGRNANAHSK